MKGGMGQGAGIPLKDRHGPTWKPPAEPEPTPATAAGPNPPPGTPCWVNIAGTPTPAINLGWQQGPDGAWHGLITVWAPATALTPRTHP